MRKIQIVSINHTKANSDLRIRFDLTEDMWNQYISFLKHQLGAEGVVLLRTCNRLELYIDASEDVRSEAIEQWKMLSETTSISTKNVFESIVGFAPCINHLLQLSAGFKSAIYGDDQILNQLKKAFEEARDRKTMSTLLERSYQSIMQYHKRICKETDFRSHTVSLAYQALKSARLKIGRDNLSTKRVMIIGAGDMAAQVVKYIPKFNYGSVAITNRTIEKAERLVKGREISVIPLSEFGGGNYDVIISCIDQGFDLISNWSQVEYYIDLSLHSVQLEDVSVPHILLGDLQTLINERNSDRLVSVDKVNDILVEKSDEFVQWCANWSKRQMDRAALI